MKRLVIVGLIFALCMLAVPSMAGCQIDLRGVEDLGQNDLTKFCRDPGSGDVDFYMTVNWDEILLTGKNTADACALFDSDSDSNANFAVCIEWDKNHEKKGVFLYNCISDSKHSELWWIRADKFFYHNL